MKRRTFLKQGVGAGVLLAGVPQRSRGSGGGRRGEVAVVRGDDADRGHRHRSASPGPGFRCPLMVGHRLLPPAGSDTWKGNAATSKLYRDDKYDAGFVYAEWAAGREGAG